MHRLGGSLSAGINPLSYDDDSEANQGKIVHAKPDKSLIPLPGLNTNPKRGPFRMIIVKSDLMPHLIVAPNDNFKGVVFIDSETLEIRSKFIN